MVPLSLVVFCFVIRSTVLQDGLKISVRIQGCVRPGNVARHRVLLISAKN
jgi:hypothetical protein